MAPPGPPPRIEDRDVIGFANKRVASSGPPAVRSFASTKEGREERQQLQQASRGRGWYSNTNPTYRGRGHAGSSGTSSSLHSTRGRGGGGGGGGSSRAFNPPSGPRRDRDVSSFSGGGDSWVSNEREEEYEPRDRDRRGMGGVGTGGLPARPSFQHFGEGPREGEAGPSSWNSGADRGGGSRMHRVYSPSQPTRNTPERPHSPIRHPDFTIQSWRPSTSTHGHQPIPPPPPILNAQSTRPTSTHTHFSNGSPAPELGDRVPQSRSTPRPPSPPREQSRPSTSLPVLAIEELAVPAQNARQAVQSNIPSRESTPTIPTAKLKFKPTKKARVPSGPEAMSTTSETPGIGSSLAGVNKDVKRKDELEDEVDTKPTMEELRAYEPVELKIQRTGTLALMKKDIPKSCFSIPGKDRVLARQEFKATHFAKLRAQGKTPKHAMWRDDGFAIDWVREDMEPSPPPAPIPKQARENGTKVLGNAGPSISAGKAVSPKPPPTTSKIFYPAEPAPVQSRSPVRSEATLTPSGSTKPHAKSLPKRPSPAISSTSHPETRREISTAPPRQTNPFESWPAPTQSERHTSARGPSPQKSARSNSVALAPDHADLWPSEAQASSSSLDARPPASSQSTWIRYFPIPDELRCDHPNAKFSPAFLDWRKKRAREACEIGVDGTANMFVEPFGKTTDMDMYRFRVRRFLPGESRELPKWLCLKEGEVDELASSPIKEENGGYKNGEIHRQDKTSKGKDHKRKSEDQPEGKEGKKKKSQKGEGPHEGKKHKEGKSQGEKKKNKNHDIPGGPKHQEATNRSTTAFSQPPPLTGTATLAFPPSSTPNSSFAAFGPSSFTDKTSIPLTPGPSLFNPSSTDNKPPTATPTQINSSATKDQLEEKLFTNLESIDKWTQMMADYPSRGEYLQKQVERVQQDIFKIQEEIRRRKGG